MKSHILSAGPITMQALENEADKIRALAATAKLLMLKDDARKAAKAATVAKNTFKAAIVATPAAPKATHTAASFAAPKITMARAEFNKLTPADSRRFLRDGGKLI